MSLDASDFTNTSGSAGSANNCIGIEPRAGGATAAKSSTAGNASPANHCTYGTSDGPTKC